MIFKTVGVTECDHTARFRAQWKKYCGEENRYLSGGVSATETSCMQDLFIDAFTHEKLDRNTVDDSLVVGCDQAAQLELEAIFRSRSRALAEALNIVERAS